MALAHIGDNNLSKCYLIMAVVLFVEQVWPRKQVKGDLRPGQTVVPGH